MTDLPRITFDAAFPSNRIAIKHKPREAAVISLDAYLSPAQLTELVAVSNLERPLRVTIEVLPS